MRRLIKLAPWILAAALLASACAKQQAANDSLRVGFDLDDTLLFSTPAFSMGFGSGSAPYSSGFWKVVNSSDRGNSKVKKKTFRILKDHQAAGADVFIITSRDSAGGEELKAFIEETFGIPGSAVFFEPDGKDGRMRKLKLDIYYGDSDTDMNDSVIAGVKPYRILRSTASSYKKKYNPGRYSEEIIKDSQR
ncbi:MAG: hypothetical protein JXJ19_04460 [Elusimicrobia bacterium]|nr:hypothetical protein [Elusimicrobiota bacterium]